MRRPGCRFFATRNHAATRLFAVQHQPCTEAAVTSLKSLSLACAAAALIGIAGLTAAQAQQYEYPQQSGPTQLLTNGPQANVETQSPNWSAQQNVIQSERYDRLLETNHSFRDARMQKECGPITDPQLHQNCIASFAQMEPSTNAATPASPRHRRS
jgi:hypothetical protein